MAKTDIQIMTLRYKDELRKMSASNGCFVRMYNGFFFCTVGMYFCEELRYGGLVEVN